MQLRLQGMFALSQLGHSPPQLVERQKILLIGGQQTIHGLSGSRQLSLQRLFLLFCWSQTKVNALHELLPWAWKAARAAKMDAAA